MEEISQIPETQKRQINQESKKVKQTSLNNSSSISFFKVGICHMCKIKGKLVYQCHRNFIATSCEKKYCYDCLTLIYKDNVLLHLQKNDSWKCPFIKKICRCRPCCNSRKQPSSILDIDPNFSVYTNLRSKVKKQGEEQVQDADDENMRCLLKQKFKKLIDFNGQLLNRVNTNYHKLTEQQIKFYNKLIHSNLSVLNHLGKSMIVHQTLVEQ